MDILWSKVAMKRIYLAYGLIVAFALSLATCLFLLFQHEEGTHLEARELLQENLAWELGQLQGALFDARIAVAAFAGGGADLDLDDVVLRFDVLRSRAEALRSSPGRDIINLLPSAGHNLDQLAAKLNGAEADLLALTRGDRERADRLDRSFRDSTPLVAQLEIDHLRYRSRASLALMETSRTQHRLALYFFAGSVLLAASLIAVLLMERANSLGMQGRLQQLVEQRTAELRREEERLRGILDNMPSAIYLQDTQGRVALVNDVFTNWYGLNPQAALGKPFGDLFQGDCVAVSAALDREIAETGQVCEGESDVRFADGAAHSLLITKFPILDAKGELSGIGTINVDITESKSIRQRLELSERRLHQAVELAGLGYWVWDTREDRCVYSSEENARIHGVTVEEYMARAAPVAQRFSFTHPDDHDRYRAALHDLRRTGALDMEYRVIRPDGEVRHVHEIAVAEFDKDKKIIREYGTIQDRTNLKLAQDRASQAQRMEAVGQLTGGIAHDFNNLIAIISGNAELLAEANPDAKTLVRPILRASQRAAELTHRLLAFSRRQSLQPQIINLNTVVEEMRPILDRALGEAVRLESDLCEDIWPVSADPGQLENAILNLAINARDAMGFKGTLGIRTTNVVQSAPRTIHGQEIAAGDYACLMVSDSGSGMSSDVLDKAFEPFFTTKGPDKGTGLGLSMVYGFARQSGGFIVLDSVEGEGTRIELCLLRDCSGISPTPPIKTDEDARGPSEPVGASQNVLIVDDNLDVLSLLEQTLSKHGYRIYTAVDAAAALEILRDEVKIGLLLSDVVLPGDLNGVELVNRALALRPSLKIVLMSGYSGTAINLAESASLGWPMLRKPFSNRDLTRTLEDELRH